jgi:hypothetical protein
VTPREVALAFWERMLDHDFAGATRWTHPDYVEDYVQSGERVRGRDNLRAIIENYPGGPLQSHDVPDVQEANGGNWVMTPGYTVVKVEESGSSGTMVVKIRYPDGSDWWMIVMFEVKDDMIYRQQSYFAPAFEPPEWRAKWVERIDG